MESTGCFKAVRADLDLGPPSVGGVAGGDGTEAPPHSGSSVPVVVKFQVQERRFTGGANASVGNDEAETSGRLSLHNVTGRCDSVDFRTAMYNTKKHRSLALTYRNPLVLGPGSGCPDARLAVELYRHLRNRTAASNHDELTHGFQVELAPNRHHTFRYDLVWRENRLTGNPTLAMFPEAGHSLKSSVTHVFRTDSRNDRLVPARGTSAQLTSELAGLGGDVAFWKQSLAVQAHQPDPVFSSPLIFSAILQAGYLVCGGRPTRINDRFELGGPTPFRGFAEAGVGRASPSESLGGNAFWLATAQATGPVPRLSSPASSLHTFVHSFVSAGSILPVGASARHWLLRRPLDSVRVTAGTGLVVRTHGCRIELNANLPLRSMFLDKPDSIFSLSFVGDY